MQGQPTHRQDQGHLTGVSNVDLAGLLRASGAELVYERTDGRGTGEPMTEADARWESAHEAGRAEAALRLLHAAVWVCQEVMTDGELLEGVVHAMRGHNGSGGIFDEEPGTPKWAMRVFEDDARYRRIDPPPRLGWRARLRAAYEAATPGRSTDGTLELGE